MIEGEVQHSSKMANRLADRALYDLPGPTAGNKAILYGDFSYYWLADREGRSLQRLNELYASTGQIGFRVTQRLDARLVQQEGMKCLTMKAGT